MKKTNLMLNLVNAEVSVSIDVMSGVNLGKRGGGGGEYVISKTKIQKLRIFVTVILLGFLLNLVLVFWLLLLLNFW
ncbi:MAG: hypothetical protein LBJ00_10300 [Planctomycetaceae bacterium]|nr:hypothetical protein [Planctomycetaceae bacterium]